MHVQSKERQEEDETKDEEGEKSAINTKYSDVVIFLLFRKKAATLEKIYIQRVVRKM